jgi:endogenous inhibitor of DNA gyrase (YacG/DUF329 family)
MVHCPRCGAAVAWSSSNPWRPFCSEPCKMVDLGAWATESYRIPVVEYDDVAEETFPSADGDTSIN